MPTITYISIEQAKEELRQSVVKERIRRFATPDLDVAKQSEAMGWGKKVEPRT